MNTPTPKPVIWMGDSLERLQEFPATVQDEVGYAIYLAQVGAKHLRAKPLRGLGSGVLEVVSDHRGDTFRAGGHASCGTGELSHVNQEGLRGG